ncbi:hypothetical protein [Maritimibacter sp. HL-12]|uniref:hypothetical protein n=1 Tax=Maritimibacter sp. HL-12 TaxID=1162418 RepID=UPI000A0EFAAE|nr:hypothetical protein [Maritimibacter sp. HL-12]SMH56118.1 Uncharacterized conserved protein, DUF2147 family [Maritimibacter sp. HL-12]
MGRIKTLAALGAAAVMLSAAPVAAGTTEWLREGTQIINVTDDGGRLFCTRASDGFEMCHGMLQESPGTWKGPKMKHPDMPGFMTFAGTVLIGSDKLKIEGCVLGGAVCDAEIWTKQ